MTGQGRGRPAIFDPTMQTEYLRLLAAGMRVQEAADRLGISRRTPTKLAERDRDFAYALADAKKNGQALRASGARTNTSTHEGATVLPLPAPNPPTGEPKNLTPAESLFRIATGL